MATYEFYGVEMSTDPCLYDDAVGGVDVEGFEEYDARVHQIAIKGMELWPYVFGQPGLLLHPVIRHSLWHRGQWKLVG